MKRKHHVQTGLQIFAETEPCSREDADSKRRVCPAIFQLAFAQNHGASVLLGHTLQPSWGGSTFEEAPANASEFSESLAKIAGRLKATTSWDRVTGKKLSGRLCTIVMLLYVLGAIGLGVALLLYTFTR
jgi:hypothetical protein